MHGVDGGLAGVCVMGTSQGRVRGRDSAWASAAPSRQKPAGGKQVHRCCVGLQVGEMEVVWGGVWGCDVAGVEKQAC